ETYPRHHCLPFAGSDPSSRHRSVARGAGGSGPLGQTQSGHAQGPRISLARRLSSVRVRGAPPSCSPIIQLVGAPVVTWEIQVRVRVGEPIRRDRLVSQDTRFSTEQSECKSTSRRQPCTRSSTG